MNRFDDYIQGVLARTECGQQEREELSEEFKSHLESVKRNFAWLIRKT